MKSKFTVKLAWIILKWRSKPKKGDIEARCVGVHAVENTIEYMEAILRQMVSSRLDNLSKHSFIH